MVYVQTTLANNRQTRRRIHIRPNLTIMKGTIADLKFIRYGDMVVPIIMGKERKKVINHIVPQGLYEYVNNLLTVNNNAQSGQGSISGWSSSSGNSIQLLNNGSVVQTFSPTIIPVLNGTTVIWLFIVNDLSSQSYSANQVNLLVSVNYATGFGGIQYSPAFNLATATTSIVKQSGEAISFIWEIQLSLGSSALNDFLLGILYSIPVVSTQCSWTTPTGGAGSTTTQVGTFAGTPFSYAYNNLSGVTVTAYSLPYYLSTITLQYIGGSTSGNINSIAVSFDGTNSYLVITAPISLSSQVTVTGVVVNVAVVPGNDNFFCIDGETVGSGSVLQLPYSATLPSGTTSVTITIEFSPAT